MRGNVRYLVIQFIKFSIVGITAFCIDYSLFLLLTYIFNINYLISTFTSYVIATVFNFTGSMTFVFKGREGQTRKQQFVIFFVLSVIGLGLNQLFIWIFVDVLSIPPWLAKLIATVLVMIFNYITRKIFLDERSKPEKS